MLELVYSYVHYRGGTKAISNRVCFIAIRWGATVLCRVGYTLGSSMHALKIKFITS